MKKYEPLDIIELTFDCEKVKIFDGVGDCYAELVCEDMLQTFTVGGVLGTHTVLCFQDDKLISTSSFNVDTKTKVEDSKGIYNALLKNLHFTMLTSCGGDGSMSVELEGKIYNHFICWIRDHTHTMKGMKYFYKDIKKGLELYADTQREDGLIYDRVRPLKGDKQGWRDYTFSAGDFIKKVYSNADGTGTPNTVQRIPVENDVEFLFLECLYYTWKACGDNEWMMKYLDNAIKAVEYSLTDKYRWSEKFKLLKRGYTIDTWDFMHHDDSELTLGDNICDIDKTTFGVMFGDNTGMAAGCEYLSEMLDFAGRKDEAQKYKDVAASLYEQLEKVAWNGKFYRHHVTEDPTFVRDVGNTDESRQVTLSNAYSLNRHIGDDKVQAIIQSYKDIRAEMPANSPGEYYNCYPPFEKGFGRQDGMWQYMNGGVSSIVAGELARGALCNGEEKYGIQIIDTMKKLADKHDGHLHVCFNGNPQLECPFERNFKYIDLSGVSNCRHEHLGDCDWGEPGNDLKNLHNGTQTFKDIPFDIKENGVGVGNSVEEVIIPVNNNFESLYFLHTTTGGGVIAEFEVQYEGGNKEHFYIKNGVQLNAWFMPESEESKGFCHAPKFPKGWPEYQLAWQGGNDTFDNVGVYIWGWDNPRPEDKIENIVIRASKDNSRYLISAITGCDKPVWFKQSDISFGIPDGWGAAAIVYALVEGLAGVVDTGVAFDEAEVSPRWNFAGETSADVVVKYEASGGYVAYSWKKNDGGCSLFITSSAKKCVVQFPVDGDATSTSIKVNGVSHDCEVIKIADSSYIRLVLNKKGVFKIEK